MKHLIFVAIIVLTVIGLILYPIETEDFMTPKVENSNKEVTQIPLIVHGKIPEWLNGTFVRNGPVSIEIDGKEIPHWFDGLAMLHAFAFQNGQVTYSNKFLRSDPYREVFEKGNLYFGGFSTPNRRSLWEKIISFVKPRSTPYIQNANVNVAEIAKQYVALTETPLPVRFDIKTMNTLGALEYDDNLPKKDIFESAHPQKDMVTKEQINYLVDYGRNSHYVVYRLDSEKPVREVIAKVPVENPAYMHSFALTPNAIILVEFPFTVNPLDLLLNKKGFINNFAWHPEQGTNFIVIDRKSAQLTTINYPTPFFAFHHVNAFEMGNDIVLDIVTYADAKIISDIAAHGAINTEMIQKEKLEDTLKQTKLIRYTLSLNEKSIKSKVLFENYFEFPRINEKLNTKKHRYVYVVDPRTSFGENDRRPLYKIDTKTDKRIQWVEPGLMPGEPVFIAHPTENDEDKGVIVTIVLDNKKQSAFLLVLDAKTFTEIARCYAPHPISTGLHGQFFEHIGDWSN